MFLSGFEYNESRHYRGHLFSLLHSFLLLSLSLLKFNEKIFSFAFLWMCLENDNDFFLEIVSLSEQRESLLSGGRWSRKYENWEVVKVNKWKLCFELINLMSSIEDEKI